jgi:hypothetical protein
MKVRIAVGVTCLALSFGCGGRAFSNTTTAVVPAASALRETCQPIDSSFALGTPVFRECGVDRQARPRGAPPRMDFEPRPPMRDCYSAAVAVVVDERGSTVPATAKVIRTTDPEFAVALLNAIPTWRFAPAQKDGMPVKQVVEIGRVAMPRVVRSDRPMTPPPNPTC